MGDPTDITAADIFTSASAPNPTVIKAARQVLRGEVPDDELNDTDTALVSAFAMNFDDRSSSTGGRCRGKCSSTASGAGRHPVKPIRAFQGFVEDRAFDRVIKATSMRNLEALRRATRRELSATGIKRNVELAQSQYLLAIDGATWNPDGRAIGTSDGQIVDLRTGTGRPAQPGDRLTMATSAPFDSTARADR